ncbi:MCP four helix bundle domain-containing protein [Paraburkholderia phenazinium]|uniref:Methyl-accepting chemotaxis protein n=1 Tax=Paraburkholderia phenazinium TaxID=60549 RepID=A0A1G8AMR0_9BURK|nr:MCP four helix bundle domain-containing protein [Paraburkholderia phenazinium]SDH22207.1 methyl-accepting chemotaxis protein [Paraburkholderia phenazinium]
MELFITSGEDKVSKIYQSIDANKKTIDEALETLDRLSFSPDEKEQAKVKESRVAYVASFSKVARLIAAEKRHEAVNMMSGETLPALDLLQQRITDMLNLEKKLVAADGTETTQNIESARNLMIGLGLAATSTG